VLDPQVGSNPPETVHPNHAAGFEVIVARAGRDKRVALEHVMLVTIGPERVVADDVLLAVVVRGATGWIVALHGHRVMMIPAAIGAELVLNDAARRARVRGCASRLGTIGRLEHRIAFAVPIGRPLRG